MTSYRQFVKRWKKEHPSELGPDRSVRNPLKRPRKWDGEVHKDGSPCIDTMHGYCQCISGGTDWNWMNQLRWMRGKGLSE